MHLCVIRSFTVYNGNEVLISNGNETAYSMIDFWRWGYSNINHHMLRGTFAEFIVKCALDQGGINTSKEVGTGLEPYDLDGPILKTGKPAKIEVKNTGFTRRDGTKTKKHPNFSIRPARIPDEVGDYKREALCAVR